MITDRIRPFFEAIAVPRAVGTPGEAAARRQIEAQLTAEGFSTTTRPFQTNQNRLLAAVVFGTATGWSALLITPLVLGPTAAAIVVPAGLGAAVFVSLLVFVLSRAERPLRGTTMESANIVARNTWLDPYIWLVAHSDSKSQGVSLVVRAMGFSIAIISWVLIIATVFLRTVDIRSVWLSVTGLLSGLVGGAILTRRHFANESPGAVDNATGVVAALVAAAELKDEMSVGVLITGAEELGMEGARRWIHDATCAGCFVNFDGIDSRGRFNLMLHGATGSTCELSIGQLAGRVAREIESVTSVPCRAGRLPQGVFVDGAVLKRGGMSGLTVSRGDRETLRIVHTRQDTPGRVDITSAAAAGKAVAVAVLCSVDPAESHV